MTGFLPLTVNFGSKQIGQHQYSSPISLPKATTERGIIRTSSRTGVPCLLVQGSHT
ncbi:hypothetical protein [Bradyrhizobium sp. SZCCHNR1093]|uniref:hypothetical protein n=1 Tax=Bradyrhizobium sp. SZCCHNR1093 TaxID=3057368 RepID=UPI0028E9B1FE|nr:hypothetical protein [Bradyrhizobium sp. SZCCHNR1093]